jgi:hypothetical protein
MAVVDSCHGIWQNCSGNIVVIHKILNAVSNQIRSYFQVFIPTAHKLDRTVRQSDEGRAQFMFHSQSLTQLIAIIEKSAIIVGFPDSHQEQISSKQLDTS